ncbi:MAG: hypothetical protein HN341_14550 [Verrucomicrobia bacterium]|nr:hypothetical protein [Verrucomicrobiota bacterium]
MKNLLESLLGIETVKGLGVVDTVQVGKMRYTTELGICRANGQFALKVCVATRGRLSRNSGTTLWPLDVVSFPLLRADLDRALAALDKPSPSRVSVNPIIRGILRLCGFRFLSELGAMCLAHGESNAYGFVAENSGVRFLAVKLVARSNTSFTWFPQSTVKAIANRLETIEEETANQNLEHISDSANAV